MTPQEKTEVRNKRILAALNLEKPDRIPITNLHGIGFFKYMDPKATMSDYFKKPKYIDDLTFEAARLPVIDEIDTAPILGFVSTAGQEAFAAMIFAKIKLPGRELPDDALWNIDEFGPMTVEDYDTAIARGWGYMEAELWKRIGFDPGKMPPPDMQYIMSNMQRIATLGKSTINMFGPGGFLPMPPFEVLSGARKLPKFLMDLKRMPEKVRDVLNIMEDFFVERAVNMLKAGPGPAPVCGFIGGTRAGSDFISTKVFEKFYFPFYQKLIPAMNKLGVKTWLHNDSDWTLFLPYFREFPKGSFVWDPDQMTGLTKIKEVLGDLCCIEGDVPPGILAIGTPDDCYKYADKLCKDMGKTGFMMSAGCSVPPNAKRENIEAVIHATLDNS